MPGVKGMKKGMKGLMSHKKIPSLKSVNDSPSIIPASHSHSASPLGFMPDKSPLAVSHPKKSKLKGMLK